MKANDKLRFWLNLAIGAVFVAYGINFFYAAWSGQQGGTFGDTFGATNSLFSGVALMMLIYAVILQREELYLIKEERDDTRKLLEGQEKINALQEDALRKQIFEQSFNSLLAMAAAERSRLVARPDPSDRFTMSPLSHDHMVARQNLSLAFESEDLLVAAKSRNLHVTLLVNLLAILNKLIRESSSREFENHHLDATVETFLTMEVSRCILWMEIQSILDGNQPAAITALIDQHTILTRIYDEPALDLRRKIFSKHNYALQP